MAKAHCTHNPLMFVVKAMSSMKFFITTITNKPKLLDFHYNPQPVSVYVKKSVLRPWCLNLTHRSSALEHSAELEILI